MLFVQVMQQHDKGTQSSLNLPPSVFAASVFAADAAVLAILLVVVPGLAPKHTWSGEQHRQAAASVSFGSTRLPQEMMQQAQCAQHLHTCPACYDDTSTSSTTSRARHDSTWRATAHHSTAQQNDSARKPLLNAHQFYLSSIRSASSCLSSTIYEALLLHKHPNCLLLSVLH
jgi:hypothetical protein